MVPHLAVSTVEHALMTTLPGVEVLLAVTTPVPLTVAMAASSDDQVTVWAGLLVPSTVAASWTVCGGESEVPALTVAVAGVIETLVTVVPTMFRVATPEAELLLAVAVARIA